MVSPLLLLGTALTEGNCTLGVEGVLPMGAEVGEKMRVGNVGKDDDAGRVGAIGVCDGIGGMGWDWVCGEKGKIMEWSEGSEVWGGRK